MGCAGSKDEGGPGLVVLQGSATYLSKRIKLDGVVTKTSDYLAAVDAMFAEMEALCGTDGGEVDQTNLANGLFAVAVLKELQLAHGTPYIMSKREFKGVAGTDIFTQLWAGFVADKLVAEASENFVVVDVGSGEIKYYAVTTEAGAGKPGKYSKYPFTAVEITKSKEIAEQFLAKFDECCSDAGTADTISELTAILSGPFAATEFKDWKVKAIGTQAMRTIQEKYPTKAKEVLGKIGDDIEIISPKDEAGFELSAVSNAFQHATDLPDGAVDKALVGNLAWGNGSCQGTIKQGKSLWPESIGMGLKGVKKMFEKVPAADGTEIKAKTICFGNAAAFTAFKDAMQPLVTAECRRLRRST
jgi:hypothetical protein